jgi:uncharacterized Zn finger protein
MTIHDFQTQIDPRVLERGQAGYREGTVLELVHESAGFWTARVAGTEVYQVTLRMNGDEIVNSTCVCPYDQGPLCKHEVAVYLAVKDDLEREKFAAESGLPQKLFRTPPFREQVAKVGEQVGKARLLDFIAETGKSDSDLKNAFLVHFADYLGEDKEAQLRRQVQHIIRSAEGRKGYLDVRDTEAVADELNALLVRYEGGADFEMLSDIVGEEVKEAMKSAEDYEGYLAGLGG